MMSIASERRVLALAGAALILLLAGRGRAADSLHAPWDRIVSTYVDADGRVAYRALAQNDRAALDDYLRALAEAKPDGWAESAQIAFWLNAYNAIIVAGVLDGYSPESFFGRKRFFGFYERVVAGESRSPEDIEHGILRAKFAEPRIHFALVCASTSCPKLRREAFDSASLESQLQDQTRTFLEDPARNRFAPRVVRISMIFRWFEEDFAEAAGSVIAFLRRYRRLDAEPRVEYLEYDWTLNAQTGQRPDG